MGKVPEDRALVITDDNAHIQSIDARAVPIAQRYWDVTGILPSGLGASWAYPRNDVYYTNPKYEYDSVVLDPGGYRISIGFVKARYSGDSLDLRPSEEAYDLVVQLAANTTYMVSSVELGDNFHVIVVEADCPADEAMSMYTREKCCDKGVIVASSDLLYVGLYKNETSLPRAEMAAVKAARAAGAPTYGETMGGLLNGVDLFGGGN